MLPRLPDRHKPGKHREVASPDPMLLSVSCWPHRDFADSGENSTQTEPIEQQRMSHAGLLLLPFKRHVDGRWVRPSVQSPLRPGCSGREESKSQPRETDSDFDYNAQAFCEITAVQLASNHETRGVNPQE